MRAVFMIVADIICEQSFQMAFIHRNDVIQQVSSAAFDPTLHHAVLPRTFEGGPHRTHPQRSNDGRNLQPVFRLPVEDQKPRSRLERKRLAQLLDDPHARRMPGDIEVQDTPTTVADHEEAVEKFESDLWYGEEVHRRNGFPMVSKVGEPTSCRFWVSWRSFHPTRDRSLGQINAEHEEFPMYPRRSPAWVLGDHSEDQIPNLLRNTFPPCWLSDPRDQAPVETKACPMPPNYCLWRDHDQCLSPAGQDLTGNDPEQFVDQIEPWPRMSTFQNGELLPQRKILQHKLPTASKNANEHSKPEQEQVVHEAGL